MLRIRHRIVLMAACGIAGVIGLAASAWAIRWWNLERAPSISASCCRQRRRGGHGYRQRWHEPGGIIVPDYVSGGTAGFGYLNPNTGLPEYGTLAIADAIKAGGNYTSPGTSTLEGLSSTNAQGQQNAVIGYFDNNANGSPYYSIWRGVDLTVAGPTQATPVTLISPTYIGDATLRGSVGLDDGSDWLGGYLAGDTGWQNGDYLNDGSVGLDSVGAWLGIYLAIPGQQYPGFIAPVTAGPIQLSGGLIAVPEPATCSLAIAAMAAAFVFRFRSRRSVS